MRYIVSLLVAFLVLVAFIAWYLERAATPHPVITSSTCSATVTAYVGVENQGAAGFVNVRLEHAESGRTWTRSEYFAAGEARTVSVELNGYPLPSQVRAQAIGIANTNRSSVATIEAKDEKNHR